MEYFRFKNESIVAVNFFVHKDARPTTSTINPTDLDLLWVSLNLQQNYVIGNDQRDFCFLGNQSGQMGDSVNNHTYND